MGTIATTAIALVGMALCLLSFVSRLTGKKSCCGEKAPKVKMKKLAAPIGNLTIKVDGMRCESCRRTLTAKFNEMEGISAKVSLGTKTAVISYGRATTDVEIEKAAESAGFELVEVIR